MKRYSLRLALADTDYGPAVRLLVDGRDLRDWVEAVESPFAESLAGAYGPLPADEVLPPSRHLVGEPTPLYTGADRRTILLVCDCGEPGCWPLEAQIVVTDSTVTWRDFRQPHRPAWSYERLGPFVFDRAEYRRRSVKRRDLVVTPNE